MKLKRAGIVSAVLVGVLAVNVNGTFGLPDAESETAVAEAGQLDGGRQEDSQVGEVVPPEANNPGEVPPEVTVPPEEGNPGAETPPEESKPEEPVPPEEENPGTETPPEESKPEEPVPPEEENPGTETPPEESKPEEPVPPEESKPEEVVPPSEVKPEEPAPVQPVQPVQPVEPEITEETVVLPEENTVYEDSNPKAVYVQNIVSPSELFADEREKVKYNVSLPIEGIPSFITQEMIIGALKCQDETGYPASVTIAQIIQESGFGKYGSGGEKGQGLSYLAYQYNNLFGIKGTGPAGSVNMRTGEQTSAGEGYTITAGFRVYNTYTEAMEDRAKLLKEVYSDLIQKATDANTFAMCIGGRWATDIRYSQSLVKQMETYDLYRLDRMTLKDFSEMIGKFANPCPGSNVTSTFGYRDWSKSFHKGIDLGTGAANIPTYAAEAGTVITVGFNSSAGNWIIIDHGNGLVTKYMHHDKMYVTEGQHVEKGQQIGLSGTTGNSTGNHLHFQVEENGVAVDPTPYLGLQNK